MFWEPLGGFEVDREPESLRLKKLFAGSVKVALTAPGFPELWTEAVHVREGEVSISSPFCFERGSRIVIHLEGIDEKPAPDGLRFRVFREDEDEVACAIERVSGQPAWVLSSFGEGTHYVNAFLEGKSAGFGHCPGASGPGRRSSPEVGSLRVGVPRSIAMKITGHKTEAVYRRYAIVNEADMAEGFQRLAGYVGGRAAR